VTQSDNETGSKHSLLFLLGMFFRRCKNKEKGTGSYDPERDQLFWLTKEVSPARLSSPCLVMSRMTERRGVFVFVRVQASTFLCCTSPPTFCPQHAPGEQGAESKAQRAARRQKNSRVPFTNVYILNGFLLVLFKFYSQNTVGSQVLQQLWLPPGKEYLR